MKILIREAKIIDPKSPFHQQIVDVKISDGIIEQIGKNIPNNSHYKEISHSNLHLSQGWMDSSVSLGEPGYEDRETISNGLQVAAKSGFTAIAILAIVGTAFAVFLFNGIIQSSSALFASSVTYLIPIVAVIIGTYFHERITSTQVISMFIVISGVILANYGQLLFKKDNQNP